MHSRLCGSNAAIAKYYPVKNIECGGLSLASTISLHFLAMPLGKIGHADLVRFDTRLFLLLPQALFLARREPELV
jgi:L-lysine 2,3-aminomutase